MSTVHKQINGILIEGQFWPPEQMLAFQHIPLEQLLKHARPNVPFYKTQRRWMSEKFRCNAGNCLGRNGIPEF